MYLAIDNGVTGTYAILCEAGPPFGSEIHFDSIPIKTQQSYTKTKQNISRIDYKKFKEILKHNRILYDIAIIERPMVNPGRWKASMSAIRALESVMILCEELEIPIQFIDSKEWQKELLPSDCEKEELKKASLDVGNRLFPDFKDHKHKDRDSLLMCVWAKRNNI